MLKGIALAAAFTLAAQDKPQATPKRAQLEESEQLKLENIQLRYEAIIAAICGRAGIPLAACVVDPRAGLVYERPAPPKPEAAKEAAKK